MTGVRLATFRETLLALLAAALLVSGFTGRTGVQIVDRAMAEYLYHHHLHGVTGEADHIAIHGTWEGFVPSHCHASADPHAGSPSDHHHIQSAQALAAASLAGALLCVEWLAAPHPPSAPHLPAGSHLSTLAGIWFSPLLPPPR